MRERLQQLINTNEFEFLKTMSEEDIWKFAFAILYVFSERMDKWIPVSERLPESNGNYLVCGRGKVWICEMLILCGIRGWCNDAKNPIVEAWMPLPEPYEPQESEE